MFVRFAILLKRNILQFYFRSIHVQYKWNLVRKFLVRHNCREMYQHFIIIKHPDVKFSFSEKATKICAIILMVLTFTK